jgi:hypothetical protein
MRIAAEGAKIPSEPASMRLHAGRGVDGYPRALTAQFAEPVETMEKRSLEVLFDAGHDAIGEMQGSESLAVLAIAIDFKQVAVVEHGDLRSR